MAFADLGDVTLFYTDEGAGQPVLLVHGYTCDSHDWDYQIPALVEKYRVIAVDLRGHGHSSAPAEGYTPRGYANDLARLLKQLGTGPVVAAGHSMGGATVVALAVEHPELVRAVVPVDSAYGFAPEMSGMVTDLVAGLGSPAGHAVARGFFLNTFYPPSSPLHLRTHHARRLEAVPAHVLKKAFEGIASVPEQFAYTPQSEAYLAKVTCPALCFRAGNANPAAVADWERAQFKHPYSHAVAWEGSGHFLHQERPAEFNALLLQWLEGLPA